MKIENTLNVHNGMGQVEITHILEPNDCNCINFIHDDILEPGTEIGEHKHGKSEELYFIFEGNGSLILDGKTYPVNSGDISLCKKGHSHGIKNSGECKMRLMVIGFKK